MRLLVIRFRANARDEIRNANCPVDCWMIPISCNKLPNPGAQEGLNNRRVTLLYVFYLIFREGLGRARASTAPQVSLGGYQRDFRYFDGKPIWTAPGQPPVWDHPIGYERDYNSQQRRWFWKLSNQFQAWDT